MGELGASVSLVAILPEVALVLGAVLVLLVEVQWKPDLRVHGILAAASIAGAVGGLFAQWREIYPNVEGVVGGEGPFPIFAYSDMVVIDPESLLFRATGNQEQITDCNEFMDMLFVIHFASVSINYRLARRTWYRES